MSSLAEEELPDEYRRCRTPPAKVAKSRPVKAGARIGLVAYGITYLLIAWLALQVAFGTGGEQTDQNGAFQTIAEQPFGQVLLWVLVVGFVAVALWRLEQAIFATAGVQDQSEQIKKRVENGARAVVFAALAVIAVRTAIGLGRAGHRAGGGGGRARAGRAASSSSGRSGWCSSPSRR